MVNVIKCPVQSKHKLHADNTRANVCVVVTFQLPAQGTDPPFSHLSVDSITHEQNIICSKTLICRQLFAGHVVSSWPMKRKEKIH